MSDPSGSQHTPLHDRHVAAGGRMVDFAGWQMPVRYTSEVEEHRAVRQAVGLFDVSHMGEIAVRGAGAGEFLQRLTPNDVTKLRPGRAHYSALLDERGTYLDDLLVYQLAAEDYLLVVNASNTATDLDWIRARQPSCTVADVSADFALLALQGPNAVALLATLTEVDLATLRSYRFTHGDVAGRRCLISRTGYTGEDGFELYLSPADAAAVWDALVESGEPVGLRLAGLGARDTLRLEAGLALYGHELDRETTPLEAGLGWVVKLGKGEFIGRDALLAQKERGPERHLIGFELRDRGIARQGQRLLHGDDAVGTVASGTWSPTFEKAIGTAYVPTEQAAPGTELTAEVRRRRLAAEVVTLPFYRRER